MKRIRIGDVVVEVEGSSASVKVIDPANPLTSDRVCLSRDQLAMLPTMIEKLFDAISPPEKSEKLIQWRSERSTSINGWAGPLLVFSITKERNRNRLFAEGLAAGALYAPELAKEKPNWTDHQTEESAMAEGERLWRLLGVDFEPVEVPDVVSSKIESTPMLLWCPMCNARHIDEGEFATKSHHTHACQTCGVVWRPALVPTTGVLFLPGFRSDGGPDEPR